MKLHRTKEIDRSEVTGTKEMFRAIHNDSIMELAEWPENCVDEIVTSIPFGNQYEYSTSLQDMGHNPDNEAFFRQMDFCSSFSIVCRIPLHFSSSSSSPGSLNYFYNPGFLLDRFLFLEGLDPSCSIVPPIYLPKSSVPTI